MLRRTWKGVNTHGSLNWKRSSYLLRSWYVWATSVGGSWPSAGESQRWVARARYGGPGHLQKVDSAYVVFVVGVVTCVVAVAART
jgi:hypothetical protein